VEVVIGLQAVEVVVFMNPLMVHQHQVEQEVVQVVLMLEQEMAEHHQMMVLMEQVH
jgi:hypothetical protein